MTDENQTPEEEPQEKTPEQIARAGRIMQHQVAALMDELKRLFVPSMKLTFIARDPSNPDMFSFLTEETDNKELIALLERMPPVAPIRQGETSNAIN